MSLESTLAEIRKEDEVRHLTTVMKQLRDFLAGALCCECGEELGHDEELCCDEDGRTLHKRCEGE